MKMTAIFLCLAVVACSEVPDTLSSDAGAVDGCWFECGTVVSFTATTIDRITITTSTPTFWLSICADMPGAMALLEDERIIASISDGQCILPEVSLRDYFASSATYSLYISAPGTVAITLPGDMQASILTVEQHPPIP